MGNKDITIIKKLEILKLYFIEDLKVKDIAARPEQQKEEITGRMIYSYIENGLLLLKFIENLDWFTIKYLIKNSKTNAAFMKLLLENYMGKVATQKSKISLNGIGDIARQIVKGASE